MFSLRVFENGTPKVSEGATILRVLDEGVPIAVNVELREDGTRELREDGSIELRE